MRTLYARLIMKLMLFGLLIALPSLACSLTNDPDNEPPTPIPTQPVIIQPTPYIVTATPQPTSQVVPTTAPLPTTAPRVTAAPCPVPQGWAAYYIASGDTLNSIARVRGTTSAQLAQANCLADANTIYVGQLIYVPPTVVATAIPTQVTCSLFPRLVIGGQGRVTPGLPNVLRSQPGTASNSVEVGQIPASGVFTVLNGPQCSGGIYWWQVNYNGVIGWTGEGQNGAYWVEPYTVQTCSPTPRLIIGGQGRVLAGSANAVRSQPGTGSNSVVTGAIPGSGVFTVLNGPQCSDGIYWWQVNYNGLIGWTGEGQSGAYWVEPYTTQTCAPTPRLLVGAQGRVLPGLPNTVRSQPGTGSGSSEIGQIPGSGIFTITSGPQCSGGINWWLVNYNGLIGWTGEGQGSTYWLEPYTASVCQLAARQRIGYSGRVTPGLPNTVRAAPGTDSNNATLGEIPAGGVFAVLAGPQCANYMNWWQVNYNGLVGWTSEGQNDTYWLEAVYCGASLQSRLRLNITARVTPGTPNRLRLQAGSTSAVIGEIPGGGSFTVIGGPQCGSEGWIWWQVNYNGTVGWTAEGDNSAYWLEPLQ